MAWQIPYFNDPDGIDLSTTDSLYVAKPIVVGAVLAGGSNQHVIVDGTIAATAAAIFLQRISDTQNNRVTINDGGVVRSFENTGVAFYTNSFKLENMGYVYGSTTGVYFFNYLSGPSTITNKGVIESDNIAIARDSSSSETIQIVNNGIISGTLFAFGQVSFQFEYNGDSAGRDLLTNNGQMIGAIYLGGGADLYDGRLGKVVGTVSGAAGNDTIHGGSEANTILGGTGADSVSGGSGNDSIHGDDPLAGSTGNDTLTGGLGNDTLDGGLGTDYALYHDKTAAVAVTLNGATPVVVRVGGIIEDTIKNIEAIYGGSGADSLSGDVFSNVFTGGAGNDSISGGSGGDFIGGNSGVDRLTGGLNADRFYFYLKTDSGIGAGLRDTIIDFSSAQGDKVVLTSIDANEGAAGDQAFNFIGSTALSGAAQLRFDSATRILSGSVDADAAAEFEIHLPSTPAMAAGDFFL